MEPRSLVTVLSRRILEGAQEYRTRMDQAQIFHFYHLPGTDVKTDWRTMPVQIHINLQKSQ